MKIIKTKNFSSAVIEVFEDCTGRVTFFNDENHWDGEIWLTKEQVEYYFSE